MSAALTPDELLDLTTRTVGHYDASAESFKTGTWEHDVSQNRAALLDAIALPAPRPARVLDFGCGPGRDLVWFREQGHEPTGLDGSARFVTMARAASGCEVLHQDMLSLALPPEHFDGVFANASLFHVPAQELPRVLGQLHATLRPGGVLFTSNPRAMGDDSEGWNGARYGSYHSYDRWRAFLDAAGFDELRHYYRPDGEPRAEQPWLATVSRKRR